MDLIVILVFLVVFLVSGIILSQPKGLPPGPMVWPFFGCISILRQMSKSKKRPHLVLYEAAKKYGSIMSLRFGQRQIVVLSGYDTVHEALVKHADVFSDRPTYLPTLKTMIADGSGILLSPFNHHWRTLRRFTLQTLRDFGVGKSSIEEKIFVEINAASKVLQETNGQPMIVAPLLQNITGNIMYGIIFGERYDYEDPDFEKARKFTNVFVGGQGPISPIHFFPEWLLRLIHRKVDKADLERTKTAERIKTFLLEKINEHEDTFDDNNIRDFIDLYIQVARDSKEETKETFTEGNMLRVIQDLFLAGSETSSTTLDWALLYMIEYPEIQRKCQKEIEQIVGDKQIEYSDRIKLPYVDATIMEIQRLANILQFPVLHSTNNDVELQGYKIPKETLVLSLMYSVFQDPKYWDRPEIFNPGRFLDKSGKIVKKDAQIPFGIGPRACLGEPLARMELFLVFANLLQRFTFHRENDDKKHSMEAKLSQITNAPLEYKLRAIKR